MNVCAITVSQISQTDTGGRRDGDYGRKIDGGRTEAEGKRKRGRRSRYTVTQILLLLLLLSAKHGRGELLRTIISRTHIKNPKRRPRCDSDGRWQLQRELETLRTGSKSQVWRAGLAPG